MDKIRYYLLFILLLINSIYVYGVVMPRIVIILLLCWLVWISHNKTFYSHKYVSIISLCYFFALILGLIHNPMYAIGESKYLVYLYAYISIMTYKWDKIKIFNYLFIISYLVNLTIIGMTSLFFMGFDLDKPYLPGADFVVRGESFGYRMTTFQSLSFFLAFNIVYFINKRDIITMIPCILGIINVFICDRRAIILFPIMVSIFYLAFFYRGKDYKKILIFIPLIAFLLILLLTILSNISELDLNEKFYRAFELIAYDSDSDDIRIKQFSALIEKFLENPILGNGLGSYAESCIRDPEMPYAYELTYAASLMKYGLIGFLLINGGYIVMLIRICRINRKDIQLHATIGGVTSLLLVSITNPYINVSLLLLLTIVFVWNFRTENLLLNNRIRDYENK